MLSITRFWRRQKEKSKVSTSKEIKKEWQTVDMYEYYICHPSTTIYKHFCEQFMHKGTKEYREETRESSGANCDQWSWISFENVTNWAVFCLFSLQWCCWYCWYPFSPPSPLFCLFILLLVSAWNECSLTCFYDVDEANPWLLLEKVCSTYTASYFLILSAPLIVVQSFMR